MDCTAPSEDPAADADAEDPASVSTSDDRLTAALAALVHSVQQRAGPGGGLQLSPAGLAAREPDIR